MIKTDKEMIVTCENDNDGNKMMKWKYEWLWRNIYRRVKVW